MVTDSAQHADLTQSCKIRTCAPDSVSVYSAPGGPVARLSPSIGQRLYLERWGCQEEPLDQGRAVVTAMADCVAPVCAGVRWPDQTKANWALQYKEWAWSHF